MPRALLLAALLLGLTVPAEAAVSRSALKQDLGASVRIAEQEETGRVGFIGTRPGQPIARPDGLSAGAAPGRVAQRFLDRHGDAFGLTGPGAELRVADTSPAPQGRSVVRLQQTVDGVPVLGGELVVNVDSAGRILSAGGEALPTRSLDLEPRVSAEQAERAALAVVARQEGVAASELEVSAARRWIYDSRLLGGPGLDRPTLVWRMEVTGGSPTAIRELVLVDAARGNVALHFSQIAHARHREVCDAANTTAQVPCTSPVRVEGGPASGVADVNRAYDFSGQVYNFYFSRFGRDSFDGAGASMVSTVRACDPEFGACPMDNGFWNGEQVVLGEGVAAADDFVGHEFTHAVNQYTSGLFYYYQSGAIDESLADVFGEFIDLTNGGSGDTADTRWQVFEDAPGGAGRDMQDPTLFGDPDRMTSPLYQADFDERDDGGVHANSSVNNKAAYLMTDGGTFNGQTVGALGIAKVARLYHEAQTNLLTSASDYADLYQALQQACANLVGTAGIKAADCPKVKAAVDAVEMNQDPPEASAPEARVCPTGQSPVDTFSDDLENTASGNWTKINILGVNEWYYPQPADRTYATSGDHNLFGYNDFHAADYAIGMTNPVTIPAGGFLRFNHAHGFDDDLFDTYDGGVVEYRVGAGAWIDAGSLFTDNGYNGVISDAPGTANPLAGRSAFVDESNGYISSRLDLSSLAGQSVRFRFRIGTDQSVDDYGWFIDDVRVYRCADSTAPTAKAPTASFSRFSQLGTSTTGNSIPVRISWASGADNLTPVGNLKYRLAVSVNGGALQNVTDWVSAKSVGLTLTPGTMFQFRVTTRDEAGNLSQAAVGPAFRDIVRQENSSITYSAGWAARLAQASAFGGFVRPSNTPGSTATTSFSGRAVGVVMPVRDDLGSAKICLVQGTTENCGSRVFSELVSGPRQVLIVFNGLDPTKTYSVRVENLSGRIELDAVIILQ